MKYFIFGVIFGLIIYTFIQKIGLLYGSEPKVSISLPTLVPTATPTPEKRVGMPVVFQIPKLKINTNIEQVGIDNTGKMDVPKDISDVGWYYPGNKPGEKGNAVIDGHLDTVTGAPAVFYYLSSLNIGDEIDIIDSQGQKYMFSVVDKKEFPFDQFPFTQVFGKGDERMLNLITCQGTWDMVNHNYSDRLVIFSKLIQ